MAQCVVFGIFVCLISIAKHMSEWEVRAWTAASKGLRAHARLLLAHSRRCQRHAAAVGSPLGRSVFAGVGAYTPHACMPFWTLPATRAEVSAGNLSLLTEKVGPRMWHWLLCHGESVPEVAALRAFSALCCGDDEGGSGAPLRVQITRHTFWVVAGFGGIASVSIAPEECVAAQRDIRCRLNFAMQDGQTASLHGCLLESRPNLSFFEVSDDDDDDDSEDDWPLGSQ